MSSEEKAPDQNSDGYKSDSDVEPVEAELADSPPLEEPAVDLGSEKPVEAEIVDSPTGASGEAEKSGITNISDDRGGNAEIGNVAMATAAVSIPPIVATPPPLATNLQNLSANGGALGALVLGIWCLLGSFITNWSIINGMLGLLLGTWGLTSRRKRMAWVGIALCTIGILMCLAQFNELVNQWWFQIDESAL